MTASHTPPCPLARSLVKMHYMCINHTDLDSAPGHLRSCPCLTCCCILAYMPLLHAATSCFMASGGTWPHTSRMDCLRHNKRQTACTQVNTPRQVHASGRHLTDGMWNKRGRNSTIMICLVSCGPAETPQTRSQTQTTADGLPGVFAVHFAQVAPRGRCLGCRTCMCRCIRQP